MVSPSTEFVSLPAYPATARFQSEIYHRCLHLTSYFQMPPPLHYEHLSRFYLNEESNNNATKSSELSPAGRTGFIVMGVSLIALVAFMYVHTCR